LQPFRGINTCGFEQLDVTNLNNLGVIEDKKIIQEKMLHYFNNIIG
jgi:lipoate-protein ligase B